MKPGEMQRRNSEAKKPGERLSWLHGFLLHHLSSGWGAAPLDVETLPSCEKVAPGAIAGLLR
jgi:hypothetical protein